MPVALSNPLTTRTSPMHGPNVPSGGNAAPEENQWSSLILLFYRQVNWGPSGLNDWSKISQLDRGRTRNSSSYSCPEPYQLGLHSFLVLPKHFGKWKVKLKFFQFLEEETRACILKLSFPVIWDSWRRVDEVNGNDREATPASLPHKHLLELSLPQVHFSPCLPWATLCF